MSRRKVNGYNSWNDDGCLAVVVGKGYGPCNSMVVLVAKPVVVPEQQQLK